MRRILYQIWIQLKMDIRDRGTLMTYYLVPLLFYFIMGAVFSSINPEISHTLSGSMVIFAVTMGAVLGMPVPIVKLRETGVLRGFRISGIPTWSVLFSQAFSAGLHLTCVSLVIFLTAPLIYGANWPTNVWAWFAILFVLLLTSLSLGLLIGVSARKSSSAESIWRAAGFAQSNTNTSRATWSPPPANASSSVRRLKHGPKASASCVKPVCAASSVVTKATLDAA